MSTGLGLSEFLLSLLLSEGTMIAAAVILLVCIVVFVGCKTQDPPDCVRCLGPVLRGVPGADGADGLLLRRCRRPPPAEPVTK